MLKNKQTKNSNFISKQGKCRRQHLEDHYGCSIVITVTATEQTFIQTTINVLRAKKSATVFYAARSKVSICVGWWGDSVLVIVLQVRAAERSQLSRLHLSLIQGCRIAMVTIVFWGTLGEKKYVDIYISQTAWRGNNDEVCTQTPAGSSWSPWQQKEGIEWK